MAVVSSMRDVGFKVVSGMSAHTFHRAHDELIEEYTFFCYRDACGMHGKESFLAYFELQAILMQAYTVSVLGLSKCDPFNARAH